MNRRNLFKLTFGAIVGAICQPFLRQKSKWPAGRYVIGCDFAPPLSASSTVNYVIYTTQEVIDKLEGTGAYDFRLMPDSK